MPPVKTISAISFGKRPLPGHSLVKNNFFLSKYIIMQGGGNKCQYNQHTWFFDRCSIAEEFTKYQILYKNKLANNCTKIVDFRIIN
jgi:hypothetical protein